MGFESGESQTPPRATAAQAQPLPRGNRTRERKSDAGSSSRRQPLLFLPYSSDAGPHSRLLCQKQPSSVSSTLPPGEGSRSSSRPLFSYPLPSTSASLSSGSTSSCYHQVTPSASRTNETFLLTQDTPPSAFSAQLLERKTLLLKDAAPSCPIPCLPNHCSLGNFTVSLPHT